MIGRVWWSLRKALFLTRIWVGIEVAAWAVAFAWWNLEVRTAARRLLQDEAAAAIRRGAGRDDE